MTATWDNVLAAIEEKVPAPTFNRWFRPLSTTESGSGEFCLVADDEFDAVFIEKNFSDLIRLHLSRIVGDPVELRILHNGEQAFKKPMRSPTNGHLSAPRIDVSRQNRPVSTADALAGQHVLDLPERRRIEPLGPSLTERILDAGLKLQYGLEHFVVGASNEFAYAACSAVRDKPGQAYNPLFLYGSVGLGKTHLLNGIGIEMLRKNPDCRVLYITSEAFMNEVIDHIKTNNMSAFRARFRDGLDVLLIDDIHAIAGKEATQQEFFHTFNALYQVGAQIVITSDQYPHEIPDLEERLRSRFQWGLIADIQAPGIETRMAILKTKADNLGLRLPDDATLFLAENIRSNVRELEGALLRLHAFAGFNDRVITLDLVKNLLRQFIRENNRQITVEAIQKAVCSYFNVKLTDLKGKGRQRAVSRPRQIAMFLAKKHTDHSYPQLGGKFGGRDHSTVISACRKVESLVKSDPTIRTDLQHLERQLARQ